MNRRVRLVGRAISAAGRRRATPRPRLPRAMWLDQVAAHRPTWSDSTEHGISCLELVSGPWPLGPGKEMYLGFFAREELRKTQAELGLTVDGRLSAQSWAALARRNEERHR